MTDIATIKPILGKMYKIECIAKGFALRMRIALEFLGIVLFPLAVSALMIGY